MTLEHRAKLIARRYHDVPEEMSNEEAEAFGLLDPTTIILILSILQPILTRCLSNPLTAFRRISLFREKRSIRDEATVLVLVDSKMESMGIARSNGDAARLAAAIFDEAGEIEEAEVTACLNDAKFMTF